mmetsp:Transcript_19699/g.27178  ORF Transcript_19699/g.27178 Transcript_19699/m.27178 type:complete len:714 (+) Transcript_19699:39-2180(+)|eukprot:CAMPEP_0201492014 /NCGR_PEP_ID=MMETSP0151_2-20130828/32023_1 /ASSEMBLY_ACC=CAM_ASM_000257 /TAXON_ID=200890 /ORGANISM="Paramoeba atlantica, Strain 621/1 / CCAP 1560/9" /LENGTH=713 /DNA_ID=CAMNT_0047878659 /DNA_START=39 /DNA_END=2180 /DNA_ORIENTATION=+
MAPFRIGFLLFFFFHSCLCVTYYVDPTSEKPAPGSGTVDDPYHTITDAVQSARFGGDSIELFSGTYSGELNEGFFLENEIDFTAHTPDDPPIIQLASYFAVYDFDPAQTNGSSIVATVSHIEFKDAKGGDVSEGSVFEVRSGSVNFVNCKFSKCQSDKSPVYISGTDEYVEVLPPSMVTFSFCHFTSNTITGSGGAMTILRRQNRVVSIIGCVFDSNTATGPGGAIYSETASFSIGASTFSNNAANGDSGYGGAIYSTSSDDLDTDIRPPKIVIIDTAFQFNSGVCFGGAIAVFDEGTLSLERSSFDSNQIVSNSDVCEQRGGAIHIEGFLLSDNTALTSNLCDNQDSGYGGALSIISSEGGSFVQNTTFDGNACRAGSDISVISGQVYFHSTAFKGNTNPSQLYVAGIARFADCNFTNEGVVQLHSLQIAENGVMSLDSSSSEDLIINQIILKDKSRFLSSVNLTINHIQSSGGIIEASRTSVAVVINLAVTVSVSASTSLMIAGSQVTNEGTFTMDTNSIFSFTDTFTNMDNLYLSEGAMLSGSYNGYPAAFHNYGTLTCNVTNIFDSQFHNHKNSILELNTVGLKETPLQIKSGAWLDGNLTIHFSKKLGTGKDLLLISFANLWRWPFENITTTKASKDMEFKYARDSFVASVPGGLSGGDVAGIVIGVIIALSLLTAAAWYFIIRPQSLELSSRNGGASVQHGDDYGAV